MPRLLTKLKLTELSLVDAPANKGAKVSIFKREDIDPQLVVQSFTDALKKYAEENGARTFGEVIEESENRRRQWQASEILYPLFSALETSLRSIAADVNVTDKAKLIQSSVSEFLAAVKEKLPAVEEELEKALKDPALAGLFTREPKEIDMDPTKKVAELETQVTELNKKLNEATAATDTVKSEKDKVEKELTEVKKQLADAQKLIDVQKGEESLTVGEVVIKKSEVGEATFKAMKAQQEQVEKSRKETEIVTLEKRAEKEFGNLTGETRAKAEALYALSKMDEASRKVIEEMLKGGDKALADLMKSKGRDNTGNPDDPQAQLNKMVDEEAEKSKVTKATAYDTVLKTAKGKELYDSIYHNQAAA